ncbi:Sporulation protein YtfJ (Spore_YtfJ) [Halobacteroides halobius DSM 5150]|uniref:Sporulation protein YtfJ (Spore_YtfJ) n=1 Tax=Halobacteroides halobius (strain ATCC 35273 / DSM 5150 / MD-1) TaxID=748449 RepID=L0K8X6_HALHC|nr:spore germination protein GerW family protein [Halobacteroides halobius]AGB40789.1 Sporulation protein YtfJ (Spore_YtfJ) [Halobacteroides halobius DSM 5150]
MQEEIVNYLKDRIDYQQVIGEPYQIEGVTLVPILDILVGGGGSNDASGGGGVLTPVAIIIIRPEGEVSFLPLEKDYPKEEITEKFPEVLEKVKNN